jgi:hypothetical protein
MYDLEDLVETQQKYTFSWDLLGDINLGRPFLGRTTSVEAYRLMQFSFRDVLEREMGSEKADEIFYAAGKLAGTAFYHHMIGDVHDYGEFIRRLTEALADMGIGILRIEKADLEAGALVLTVSEDLDCSGLPERDLEVCVYDEGFIAGLLECFTGTPFNVKEIDCWCTGDRTCRFDAKTAA